MNSIKKVLLDTEEGALQICRRNNNSVDMVDVFRVAANQNLHLGFLLCINPDTNTLFGKLTDSEYEVLSQYLAQARAMRGAEHDAEMVIVAADELAGSTIMNPEDAEKLQQAADLLRAILEGQGFSTGVLATTPSISLRYKLPVDEGFTWSFIVDATEETYHVGVAGPGQQAAVNPFEQTPEDAQFLAFIDAAQKDD